MCYKSPSRVLSQLEPISVLSFYGVVKPRGKLHVHLSRCFISYDCNVRSHDALMYTSHAFCCFMRRACKQMQYKVSTCVKARLYKRLAAFPRVSLAVVQFRRLPSLSHFAARTQRRQRAAPQINYPTLRRLIERRNKSPLPAINRSLASLFRSIA